MKPLHILLIEDSQDDALRIVGELRRGGYEPSWERVDTAEGLQSALPRQPWDVITCGWMMLHFSAMAALSLLHELGVDVPVLVVSAAVEEELAVPAMKAGARDLITKSRLTRLCSAVEQELREAQLRRGARQLEQELRLRSEIITHVSEGVYLIRTSDGVIVYTNPRFDQMFGYASGELIGKNVSIVNAPTDRSPEDTAREIQAALIQDGRWQGELCNVRKDGTRFWCRASVSTFEHPEFGTVWVSVHQDITARKQAEEQLGQSQSFLRAICEGTSDAVYVKDLRGCYLLFNPGAERVTGTKEDTVLGNDDMCLFPADQARTLMDADRRVIEAKQAMTFEEEITIAGEDHVFLSTKGPILDDHGNALGLFGITKDITERKRGEEEIRRLNAELEGRVARRTAELKQRNRDLRILSRRLVEAQERERQSIARELHDEIGQTLTGLLLTLEAGLTAPRVTKGRVKSALVLVRELMQRVRSISLDLRPAMLDDLGLIDTLHWHFERYTDQTQVHVAFAHEGVEGRFSPDVEIAVYRIVQEALTNVARHAGAKDVSVSLRTDGEHLDVEVEDRGAGLDRDRAMTSWGAGLKNISERAKFLGGTAIVDSTPGAGTRVKVHLPLLAAVSSNSG